MLYTIVMYFLACLVDLITAKRMSGDEKDLEILRILQEDAKTPVREIGRRIEAPITTVYSRIKRLEDSGVIEGYKPVLDSEKLGKPTTAFILASFSGVTL